VRKTNPSAHRCPAHALGYIGKLEAILANDEHNMLVALVRRPRESLHQLLDRLEQALGPAVDDQIFVDEINGSNRLPRGGFARL